MVREASGVIVGYLAMVAVVMLTFPVAQVLVGPERAFRPESYEVSGLWLAVSFVLGAAAAVVGGWVCARIGRSTRAVKVLAGGVLVLGLLMAVPALLQGNAAPAEPRTPDVTYFEALQKAKQPPWVALLNPFVGAAGVLLGARLRRADAD